MAEDGLALIHGDATKGQVQVTPASFTGKTSDTIDYDGLALPNFMPTILDSDGLNEVIKKIDDKIGIIDSAITTGDAAQVSNSLYDANTILKADTDDTPLALTVPVDTLVGRKTGGNISALIPADVLTVLGITATIAELNFVSGVTSAIQTQIDGNDTDITNLQAKFPVVTADIQNVAVTNAKIANNAVSNAKLDSTLQTDITQITTNKTNITTLTNLTTIAEQTIFGRRTGDSTAIGLTATQTLTLLGITVSATDINRLVGITDDVQVQIDNISDTFGNIDAFDEVTISGMTAPTSVDLIHIIAAGIAFINNKRVVTSDTSHTYTASKDTYVDVDDAGTFTFIEVANGADAPALTTNSIRIMKVVTDVDNITGVTDLRPLDLRIDKLLGRKMDVPSGVTATLVAGGSLVDGTELFYVVTATDGTGETIQSIEVSATPTGANLTIKIDWTAVTKAKFYNVYRRASGIYKLFKQVTAPTITLTDDGSAIFVSVGSPPLFTNAYRAKLEDIGDVTLEIGSTDITSGTVGRILFEGTGNILQESANLTWNDATSVLTVTGNINISGNIVSATTTDNLLQLDDGSGILTLSTDNLAYANSYVLLGNGQADCAAGMSSPGVTSLNLFAMRSTGFIKNEIKISTDEVTPANSFIDFVSEAELRFRTNDPPVLRMTIDDAGRIAFGSHIPSTNVHISESNTDTVPAVEIEQLDATNVGDAALQFSIVGDAYAMGIDNSDGDKFKISYAAGAGTAVLGTNDRFVIDSAGLVGIGVSTPAVQLHLVGTTGFTQRMQAGSSTSLAAIQLQNDTTTTDQLNIFNWGTAGAGTTFGISNNNLATIEKVGNGNLAIGTIGTGFLVLGTNDAEALRINSSQNISIGTATSLAKLTIDQPITNAAIPVLFIKQGDISEEMIEFDSTIGVGNAIEAVGAKSLTVTHFIKVTLPGSLTRYLEVGTIA